MFSRMFIKQVSKVNPIRLLCTEVSTPRNVFGTREVVGFGSPCYYDSTLFPYPPIRFREITPNIKAIKEKEKGNWKSLTIDEKKCLYRVSFCQTLVEVEAPTGEWKDIIGSALICISAGLMLYIFINIWVRGKLPESFNPENQQAQLKRIIQLRMNPIDGIASKWDYDKMKWK